MVVSGSTTCKACNRCPFLHSELFRRCLRRHRAVDYRCPLRLPGCMWSFPWSSLYRLSVISVTAVLNDHIIAVIACRYIVCLCRRTRTGQSNRCLACPIRFACRRPSCPNPRTCLETPQPDSLKRTE